MGDPTGDSTIGLLRAIAAAADPGRWDGAVAAAAADAYAQLPAAARPAAAAALAPVAAAAAAAADAAAVAAALEPGRPGLEAACWALLLTDLPALAAVFAAPGTAAAEHAALCGSMAALRAAVHSAGVQACWRRRRAARGRPPRRRRWPVADARDYYIREGGPVALPP